MHRFERQYKLTQLTAGPREPAAVLVVQDTPARAGAGGCGFQGLPTSAPTAGFAAVPATKALSFIFHFQ